MRNFTRETLVLAILTTVFAVLSFALIITAPIFSAVFVIMTIIAGFGLVKTTKEARDDEEETGEEYKFPWREYFLFLLILLTVIAIWIIIETGFVSYWLCIPAILLLAFIALLFYWNAKVTVAKWILILCLPIICIFTVLCTLDVWTNSHVTFKGDTTFEGNVIVEKGDITVNEGNVNVNKGDVNVNEGNVTVDKGDITVNEGNVTVDKGDITVNEGDVNVNKGDVNVNEGNVNVNAEPKHEHSYSSKKTNATCTGKGYTTYTCSCGETYTDGYTDALGHNYSSEKFEATCTENGFTMHICKRCGDVYTDNEIDALGHWYKKQVIDSTSAEKGYTLYTCRRCNHSYKDNYTDKLPEQSGGYDGTCSIISDKTSISFGEVAFVELEGMTYDDLKFSNERFVDFIRLSDTCLEVSIKSQYEGITGYVTITCVNDPSCNIEIELVG